MNSDSELRRFVVLLDKAPFILFLESPDYRSINARLSSMGFSDRDTIIPLSITRGKTTLLKLMPHIDKLSDEPAHKAIEVLFKAMVNNATTLPVHFFTSGDWQDNVKWQNVDNKPTSQCDFTITVNKFTHDLHTVYSNDLPQNSTPQDHDGFIHLFSLDTSIPFPLLLLKDCVINIHDIIVQASLKRISTVIAESKYLSVMQTGHSTFNWVNLKKIEKDLKVVLTESGITIEE